MAPLHSFSTTELESNQLSLPVCFYFTGRNGDDNGDDNVGNTQGIRRSVGDSRALLKSVWSKGVMECTAERANTTEIGTAPTDMLPDCYSLLYVPLTRGPQRHTLHKYGRKR